jgi:hypothetical protein
MRIDIGHHKAAPGTQYAPDFADHRSLVQNVMEGELVGDEIERLIQTF